MVFSIFVNPSSHDGFKCSIPLFLSKNQKFSQATCFEDGGTELIWTAIGHGRDCRGGDIPLLHLGQLNKACLVRMITEWLGKRYFLKRFPLLPWADLNGDLLLKNSQ
jgi:hypothetical protein